MLLRSYVLAVTSISYSGNPLRFGSCPSRAVNVQTHTWKE